MHSIHQYTIEGIDGEEIDLSSYAGKKLLLVNVASACGFTPQYAQLQELYEHFQDRLTVIGLPSNDFGGQEPGSHEEIKTFCSRRYGVSFPLTKKVSIKGSTAHPLYQWLQQKDKNGQKDSAVQWNFHKYLLDEKGQLIESFPSVVSPLDDAILSRIEAQG